MKSTPTYTTGRRCAEAHLLRPADDKKQKPSRLSAVAKVAVLAPLRAATIAHSASALKNHRQTAAGEVVRMRLPYPSIFGVAP